MSKSLAFLPEVPDDIEQGRDWYAERNPEVADRFLAALEQVLDTIEQHPQQGAYHDERRLTSWSIGRNKGTQLIVIIYELRPISFSGSH